MTQTPEAQSLPPVAPAPEPIINPAPGSRLDQLHSQYVVLKATADDAQALLKACTEAIKVELSQAAPGERAVTLRGPGGPSMRLQYTESRRLDTTRFRRDHADLYAAYTKPSGSWGLRQIREGE